MDRIFTAVFYASREPRDIKPLGGGTGELTLIERRGPDLNR